MQLALDDLLDCLSLERLDSDRFALRNLPLDYYRVFGGQLLAQAIVAAAASDTDKCVKSMHVTFPAEGERDRATELRVRRTHTGRSFATRQIEVVQGDRPLMVGTVLLHVDEEGFGHRLEIEPSPPPDRCEARDLEMIPWETRLAGSVDLASPELGTPELAIWMKAPGSPGDATVQQALVAHATDLTLIGTALRAWPGVGQADSPEKLRTAVVSHTLWFHAPLDLREWTRLVQSSPVSGRGRCFGQGHVVDEDGRILASYAQEGVIRQRR